MPEVGHIERDVGGTPQACLPTARSALHTFRHYRFFIPTTLYIYIGHETAWLEAKNLVSYPI